MINEIITMPDSAVRPPKSTVISVVPWGIHQFKPGLIPGNFFIPPSINDEPVCFTVGESIHYVYLDRTRGSMMVTNPSYMIARAIVQDYIHSQIEASSESHPGLFWVQGEFTPAQVKSQLTKQFDQVKQIQRTWFERIVRVGDDDWERTRQHNAISDFQRLAAKRIDPENKRGRQWIMTELAPIAAPIELISCPSCGSELPKGVVVCRYCRYVMDKVKYMTMQFAEK